MDRLGERVPRERSEEQEAPDAPGRRERGRAASPRPKMGKKWHTGPNASSTGARESSGVQKTNTAGRK